MISRPRSSFGGPWVFVVPLKTVLGRVTFKVPLAKPISKRTHLRAPQGAPAPALPSPPDAAASRGRACPSRGCPTIRGA